jgi:tetratricopeptide (TPR) repeat protein
MDGPKGKAARAERAERPARPDGQRCYICLDDEEPAIRPGCACRTTFVHPACLITQAEHKTEAWHTCGTCKQALTGPMRAILAEAWVRQTVPARLLHEARVHLARVRIADGNYTDAERILREEMQRRSRPLRPSRPSISASMTLGECLKRQGRYTDSERTYRELVASIDDKSSYDSLCARSSLGQVLLETNPKEAERVHREVVETAVRVLDPESIQVLSFTGDLALAILYNQRFEEARSMLAPLVERMCRILGPVHPDTLTTKGNLALALHLLGNSAEAAGIQSAILAELSATLGADHPSSVSAKANLADYLARSTGSLRDSVQMAREVLDSNRKVLGPEHPDTLMCALSLSSLMMLSGSGTGTSTAEEIIRTTVAIAEKSGLPATGAHRLGASSMLADCMHQQGKTTEAVGVMHGLVAACREQLGEHSESTVAATKRLEYMASHDRIERPQRRCIICLESDPVPIQCGCACRGDPGLSHIQCMVNQAEYRDKNGSAAEMPGMAWFMCLICKSHFTGTMKHELARAWFERTRHLPAGDLRRVRPEQHLIECAYAAGNYIEAENLARSMLHRNRIHLGETHPITLYTDNMLGNTLCCLERYEEAETVQRRVLAATIIVSGARGGPHALQMSSLANTLGKQGKFPEALRLAKEAVAILRSNGATAEAASGSTDEMFLTAASTLAYLFGEQGDEAGAIALYSEVLAMQSRILGPDHPETLTTKANLAATMSRQGNYEEAKLLEMSVLRTMQRVLGPAHPHTLFAKENLEYTLRCAQAAKDSTDSKSKVSADSKIAKGPGGKKEPKEPKSTNGFKG